MDFSYFLVAAFLVATIAWLGWRHSTRHSKPAKEPVWVDLCRTISVIFLVILLVRSFVIEPYKIPSGSMMPTLQNGDFIVVSKNSYGLRLPIFNTLILPTGHPARGDVVVFRKPGEPKKNYIKRVIGVPGDRLFYNNRRLYVNGVPVELRIIKDDQNEYEGRIDIGIEIIDGVQHRILHQRQPAPGTIMQFEKTVPVGHYFVMGDNRDDSQDSRYENIGFVPQENLVGKATRIWLNSNDWDRVGNRIQ